MVSVMEVLVEVVNLSIWLIAQTRRIHDHCMQTKLNFKDALKFLLPLTPCGTASLKTFLTIYCDQSTRIKHELLGA